MIELGVATSDFIKIGTDYYQVLSDQNIDSTPKVLRTDGITESYTVDHDSAKRTATFHIALNSNAELSGSNRDRAQELFNAISDKEVTDIGKLTDNFYFEVTYMTEDSRSGKIGGPTTTTFAAGCTDIVSANTINDNESLDYVIGKLLHGILRVPVLSEFPIGVMRDCSKPSFKVVVTDIKLYQSRLNLNAFPESMRCHHHIFPEKVWRTCYDYMHIDHRHPVTYGPNDPDYVDLRPFTGRECGRVGRSIEDAPFRPDSQSLQAYLGDKVLVSSVSSQGITLPTTTLTFVPKQMAFEIKMYVGGMFKLSNDGVSKIETVLTESNMPGHHHCGGHECHHCHDCHGHHHPHRPHRPHPDRPTPPPTDEVEMMWLRCTANDIGAKIVVENDFSEILFNRATMVHIRAVQPDIPDIQISDYVKLVKVPPTTEDTTGGETEPPADDTTPETPDDTSGDNLDEGGIEVADPGEEVL